MQGNLKLIIVTTVWQRSYVYGLHRKGVERLIPYAKEAHNIDIEVVVVGSEGAKSKSLVPKNDSWHYIEVSNKQLGKKLNAGYLRAEEENPDYVMKLDSDDVMSNGLFDQYAALMKDEADYIGCIDFYEYDLVEQKLSHWPGYLGEREGEFVGTGRCVSRRVLEYLDWKPVHDHKSAGLDGSMTEKMVKLIPFIDVVPIVVSFNQVLLCGLKGWYSLSSNAQRPNSTEVYKGALDTHLPGIEILGIANYEWDDNDPNYIPLQESQG